MGGQRIPLVRGPQDLHLSKLRFMYQESYFVSGSTPFTSWARQTARHHQHLVAALGRSALKFSIYVRGGKTEPTIVITPAVMQLACLSSLLFLVYIYIQH